MEERRDSTPIDDGRIEMPAPSLTADEARQHLASEFGLDAALTPLGSQQDLNFLLRTADGDALGVLKISNPAFGEDELELQTIAAGLVAEAQPSVRAPRLVSGPRGAMSGWWSTSEGPLHARVLEYLDGTTLSGSRYLAPRVVERLGELAARVSLSLRDVDHPAADRFLQWDMRRAVEVVESLLPREPDAEVRALASAAAAAAARALDPVAGLLPVQLGHFDLTDDNVLRRGPNDLPDAIIDFGDVLASWAVGEIAVTVSSLLHHEGASPLTALPAIRRFHELRPLSADEVDALWPLVVLRGVVLVLSGRHQVRLDGGNAYAEDALDREYRILQQARSLPIPVMTALLHGRLGTRAEAARPVWTADTVLHLEGVVELTAGVDAELYDDGAWLRPDVLDEAAMRLLDAGASVVHLPAGEPVLAASGPLRASAPSTTPTGATLWFAEPVEIDLRQGRGSRTGTGLTLAGDEARLVVTAAGVEERDGVAVLPRRRPVFVQLLHREGAEVPPFTQADAFDGWRAEVGDPRHALGLPEAPPARPEDLLGRRERVLAEVQEHYYERPPQIERGWREHLIDTHGRVYLDMVNNVTSVGHAHPRIRAAADRQLRLLNTNSRFNYAAITEYAERIVDTLPDGLDTVFFVNSGSEAVDLALRLAMARTGRRDVVAMREAYHGWTYASDAVSTSVADNPAALTTRPDWVHTVDAANSYRGRHRGGGAAAYALEAVESIRRLAADGRPPAAFLCEAYFGNAGGVALPDGYLSAVYAAVRELGGIAIADEVQVGYGRLGDWFWGFEQQGVVPDVVTVAKSIGSGFPIGAVVTRREIADGYRKEGYFFSSTGGSPLSSVIGATVLDIIESEHLQENARTVGGHLKHRLQALGRTHPLVGAVHGSGLYLGLELVRDRRTLEPATEETRGICDRLLELGVVMQPTGDHQNVLKIKPPLCITRESVDFFVDSLEHVLETGW